MVGWKGKDAVKDGVVAAFRCLLNCLRKKKEKEKKRSQCIQQYMHRYFENIPIKIALS